MKAPALSIFISFLLAALSAACQSPNQPAQFVASTPCDSIAARLLNLEPGPCEMMQWALSLDAGGQADSFHAELQYGMSRPGTHGFSTRKEMKWSGHYSRQGEKLSLEPNGTGPRVGLRQVDVNHLHLLNAQGEMMRGDAGFPYTMNRTVPAALPSAAFPKLPADFPFALLKPVVFEGRTPCSYMNAFFARADSARCQLVKWRLTFYPAERGNYSGRVKLFRIRVGSETTPRDAWGTWYGYQGWGDDAGRGVVEMSIDGLDPAKRLTLVFMDENNLYFANDQNVLLTGNDYASYTLSRGRGF